MRIMQDIAYTERQDLLKRSVDSQTLSEPSTSQNPTARHTLSLPGHHFDIQQSATLSAGLSSDQSSPAKSPDRVAKRKQYASESNTNGTGFGDANSGDETVSEGDIEDGNGEVETTFKRPWVFQTPDRNLQCIWPARKELRYVPCLSRFGATIFDNSVDQLRFCNGIESSSSQHSVIAQESSSCTDFQSDEPYGPEEPPCRYMYTESLADETRGLDTSDAITIYYNVDNNDLIVSKEHNRGDDTLVGGLDGFDENYEWVERTAANLLDRYTSSVSSNSSWFSGSDSGDRACNNEDIGLAWLNNYVCREELPPKIKRRKRKRGDKDSSSRSAKRRRRRSRSRPPCSCKTKKSSGDSTCRSEKRRRRRSRSRPPCSCKTKKSNGDSTCRSEKRRRHRSYSRHPCSCKTGKTNGVPKIARKCGFRVLEPLYNKVLKLQTINRTNFAKYKCCEEKCASKRRWTPVNPKRLKKDYHTSDLRVSHYEWGDWKEAGI